METFKFKDVTPESYKREKDKFFVCPTCRQVFKGNTIELKIDNAFPIPKEKGKLKTVFVNNNFYWLACPKCKSIARTGFSAAYGYE
jgi:uncharacterized C2H2 Zn-finger protein